MTRFHGTACAALLALSALVAPPALADGPEPQARPVWKQITDLTTVRGMDGKLHTATCSGFPGTDPTFSFWARKGQSRNLAIYFEGGGACWDNLTCSFPIAGLPDQVPQFFVPQVPPGADPSAYDGIFRSGESTNPIADWDMVYIPYCTGDLHAGSATRQYTSVGHPVLPLPAGTPFTIQHRGFDNFMVVMDWVRKHFRAPDKVLVAGSSAGGYGASINFPWIARTYPQSRLYVLADASQGVTTENWDKGGRSAWNLQFAPGAFGPNPNAVPSKDLLRTAAKSHPRAKVAQFTTQADLVQIGFYGVMKGYYGPGGACPYPAADWNQQMLGTLQSYNAEVGNFRSYLAAGMYHTNLRSPAFYTEASTGVAYTQWVASMLANGGGAQGFGGGDWQDLACPGCLNPLPCTP